MLVLSTTLGFEPRSPWWSVAIGLFMAGWLGRSARWLFVSRAKVRSFVMGQLSGMCLVDAYFLSLLDQPGWALVAMGCFGVTAWSQRMVSGA